jgi:DNA-binding MarR family transcriptional regulator
MKRVKTSPEAGVYSTRERPHLGVLLGRARRRIDEELQERLTQAGFEGLRVGHGAVFSFLPTTGARLTELAQRGRMTKQAMGEVVRELEALGYVERQPDPTDGRAKVVRFTDMGMRAYEVGLGVLRDVETEWAAIIGTKRMAALRADLQAVVGVAPARR